MKILFSADWHINLHKKKIPYSWSANRFRLFFEKIRELEKTHDMHIIAGDVFDKKPEPDEICLFLSFINTVSIPTYVIPGNHEATEKGKTFLEYFHEQYAITNPNFHLITKNTRETILSQDFYFFPYTEVQKENLLLYKRDEVLVTHIRGEVPPHISAEFDFEKLRPWKLILLGDIHFSHRYMDYPAYYSGSPLNTTFDRDERKNYGVNSISFNSIDSYTIDFIDLKLPKLLRKTINVDEQMVKDSYNHVIYELTGSIDQLSKVKNNELLDKKIAHKPMENSKLNLKNLNIAEELIEYLKHNKITNINEISKEFKDLKIIE